MMNPMSTDGVNLYIDKSIDDDFKKAIFSASISRQITLDNIDCLEYPLLIN